VVTTQIASATLASPASTAGPARHVSRPHPKHPQHPQHPHPPPSLTPSAGSPPAADNPVILSFGLPISIDDFDDSAQRNFIDGIAAAGGVDPSNVEILSIEPARRRAGIKVDVAVAGANPENLSADNIKHELIARGFPEVTVEVVSPAPAITNTDTVTDAEGSLRIRPELWGGIWWMGGFFLAGCLVCAIGAGYIAYTRDASGTSTAAKGRVRQQYCIVGYLSYNKSGAAPVELATFSTHEDSSMSGLPPGWHEADDLQLAGV